MKNPIFGTSLLFLVLLAPASLGGRAAQANPSFPVFLHKGVVLGNANAATAAPWLAGRYALVGTLPSDDLAALLPQLLPTSRLDAPVKIFRTGDELPPNTVGILATGAPVLRLAHGRYRAWAVVAPEVWLPPRTPLPPPETWSPQFYGQGNSDITTIDGRTEAILVASANNTAFLVFRSPRVDLSLTGSEAIRGVVIADPHAPNAAFPVIWLSSGRVLIPANAQGLNARRSYDLGILDAGQRRSLWQRIALRLLGDVHWMLPKTLQVAASSGGLKLTLKSETKAYIHRRIGNLPVAEFPQLRIRYALSDPDFQRIGLQVRLAMRDGSGSTTLNFQAPSRFGEATFSLVAALGERAHFHYVIQDIGITVERLKAAARFGVFTINSVVLLAPEMPGGEPAYPIPCQRRQWGDRVEYLFDLKAAAQMGVLWPKDRVAAIGVVGIRGPGSMSMAFQPQAFSIIPVVTEKDFEPILDWWSHGVPKVLWRATGRQVEKIAPRHTLAAARYLWYSGVSPIDLVATLQMEHRMLRLPLRMEPGIPVDIASLVHPVWGSSIWSGLEVMPVTEMSDELEAVFASQDGIAWADILTAERRREYWPIEDDIPDGELASLFEALRWYFEQGYKAVTFRAALEPGAASGIRRIIEAPSIEALLRLVAEARARENAMLTFLSVQLRRRIAGNVGRYGSVEIGTYERAGFTEFMRAYPLRGLRPVQLRPMQGFRVLELYGQPLVLRIDRNLQARQASVWIDASEKPIAWASFRAEVSDARSVHVYARYQADGQTHIVSLSSPIARIWFAKPVMKFELVCEADPLPTSGIILRLSESCRFSDWNARTPYSGLPREAGQFTLATGNDPEQEPWDLPQLELGNNFVAFDLGWVEHAVASVRQTDNNPYARVVAIVLVPETSVTPSGHVTWLTPSYRDEEFVLTAPAPADGWYAAAITRDVGWRYAVVQNNSALVRLPEVMAFLASGSPSPALWLKRGEHIYAYDEIARRSRRNTLIAVLAAISLAIALVWLLRARRS